MGETDASKESLPPQYSFTEIIEMLFSLSSFKQMRMVVDCLEGRIGVRNITPEEGRKLKEIRNRLSVVNEWVITMLQIPRLRELVKQELLTPQEAVAAFRAFENYFFRYPQDGNDGGINYATTRSVPAIKNQFKFDPDLVRLIETAQSHPEYFFAPLFSPSQPTNSK